ncbi:MAG: GNAT family N-acetyltransferase [Solobacterium sp.]|nr:GNAT family N-acetyltransferase [Solobacterium sp.]
MVREYHREDIPSMIRIWNAVVEDGTAFPQEELLDEESGAEFFASQSYTAVAEVNGRTAGLYILHPNNIGRCGHICNASYAVDTSLRGHGIGRALVQDCLKQGERLGFRILQFNAVVESNTHARTLYESLGFLPLGVIPGGFRMKDGSYENICPYYHLLQDSGSAQKAE